MSNAHTEQSEASRYPNVRRLISESPWAILPDTFAVIREVVAMHVNGERFSAEEIQARVGASPARRELQKFGGVALIPVYGVITPKADLFSEMSGGTSIERLQSTLRDALADESITAIALDVSSPGGSVALLPELAKEIRDARGTKPIVAVANTRAASAAYWIASQADEIVITPSGDVGSIGVFAAHEDVSAMQEKLGIKTTLISAGKFKTEANPFEPLSEEALAELQRRVEETYGQFVDDVAAGRGVSASTVEEDFGQGRMLTAKRALRAGMVDRIDTFEATVRRLNGGGGGSVQVQEQTSPIIEDGGDAILLNGNRSAVTTTVSATDVTTVAAAGTLLNSVSTTSSPDERSGRSFAEEAAAARDANVALVDRARSLAEFRVQGRLTAVKREQLDEALVSLNEARAAVADLLAATDPERTPDNNDFGLEAELLFQHTRALTTT